MPIEVDFVHLDTYIKAKVTEDIPSIPVEVLLDSISELKPTTWVSSVSLRDSHHMNRAFPLSAQHLSFELQLQRSQKDPLLFSTCRGQKPTELTQNIAMTSTISQVSAETSSGTAANHHPFDGDLVKTEHPTAPSSAKPSLKRQVSPVHDTMDKNSKKARVQPAQRSSVRHRQLYGLDLSDDDDDDS
ncbi:hypothetical protein BDV39DRAFT_195597 [Aspergillus sergii]|uniref:Uncharacterized protein n=1 Tax=Aspergillus sergii TaxID=1034303 RepID=A0A5N6WSQ7_9EURO|nr:hypothetical protein BDV39DRAFT_195597 [Aspergillus sergii]